jgi:hypothetical protein
VQVNLDNGLCTAYHETNSASGAFESGSCPGGSADGTSVTRTYSLAELGARGWKVNIEGQAQVSFGDATNLATSGATANGGVWVNVEGGGATYAFHGTQTALPVPEPSAALLALTAVAALGARAARGPARARWRHGARVR